MRTKCLRSSCQFAKRICDGVAKKHEHKYCAHMCVEYVEYGVCGVYMYMLVWDIYVVCEKLQNERPKKAHISFLASKGATAFAFGFGWSIAHRLQSTTTIQLRLMGIYKEAELD